MLSHLAYTPFQGPCLSLIFAKYQLDIIIPIPDSADLAAGAAGPDPDGPHGLRLHHTRCRRGEIHLCQEVINHFRSPVILMMNVWEQPGLRVGTCEIKSIRSVFFNLNFFLGQNANPKNSETPGLKTTYFN